MNQLNRLMQMIKRGLYLMSLATILILVLSLATYAQDYNKKNLKHQHAHYKKNENQLLNACGILSKKRHYIPHKSFLASHKRSKPNKSERSVLQIDKSEVTADASGTKPTVKPKVQPKIEHISTDQLEKLHKKEDEVLVKNNLPLPTSRKQQEVRKKVSDQLASKQNIYPLALDPLYFQVNQDEFSVVDMEPFMMAAEYALQGRTVLIEGHTDNRGQNDFNVKLSIKRVQKIRQLMIDMGVPDDRISVVGYGEELSKKKTKEEADHQLNRRVDFTIF